MPLKWSYTVKKEKAPPCQSICHLGRRTPFLAGRTTTGMKDDGSPSPLENRMFVWHSSGICPSSERENDTQSIDTLAGRVEEHRGFGWALTPTGGEGRVLPGTEQPFAGRGAGRREEDIWPVDGPSHRAYSTPSDILQGSNLESKIPGSYKSYLISPNPIYPVMSDNE